MLCQKSKNINNPLFAILSQLTFKRFWVTKIGILTSSTVWIELSNSGIGGGLHLIQCEKTTGCQKTCLILWHCSIDATNSQRLGRFLNDEPKRTANCLAKSYILVGKPRVLFFAARDIRCGEEIRYDYGGGDLPWRKVSMVWTAYSLLTQYCEAFLFS